VTRSRSPSRRATTATASRSLTASRTTPAPSRQGRIRSPRRSPQAGISSRPSAATARR
jgi:hypothetical protein